MPYCPECGREQRCGCPDCHICGVVLVGPPVPPASGEVPGSPTRKGRIAEPARAHPAHDAGTPTPHELLPTARHAQDASAAFPALLLCFGCGILLITLLEAVKSAFDLPGLGNSVSAAETVKRIGYYTGNLLYFSSVRGLTGFALLGAGLLWDSGRLFRDRELYRVIRRIVGALMGVVAALCLASIILLVLPLGADTILKELLPPLWATVPILAVMGAALSGGAWIMGVKSYFITGEHPGKRPGQL